MTKLLSILLITVGFFGLSGAQLDDRLHVQVLFESLCPDSYRFVQDLYNSWATVAPYISVDFVPFGKSRSLEGGTQFICQHGPLECKGNRIMSCALSQLDDQTAQMEYVSCFMVLYQKNKHNKQEYGEMCARRVGLDTNAIQECYDSRKGTELQLVAEQKTAVFSPSFIPTVIYNNQFDQGLQDKSIQSFLGIVCELVKQQFPRACEFK